MRIKEEDKEFVKSHDSSIYDRPSVAVDILPFTQESGKLKIVLVKRGVPPFKGAWALPGGFIHMDESADDAARRELEEETGMKASRIEQLYTFSEPGRDPRMRVLSVAYLCIVPEVPVPLAAGTDASEAELFTVTNKNPLELTSTGGTVISEDNLAFDHAEIIRAALARMEGKVWYTDIAFSFLRDRESFTYKELMYVFEAILGKPQVPGNFRRRINVIWKIESTGKYGPMSGIKIPELFRFAGRKE